MNNAPKYGLAFIALIISLSAFSQDFDRVAFYNVENFFDTQYDSTKYFNGFTPQGDHHWTKTRYLKKRQRIYKVIAAVGGWNGVSVMGFAEIENRGILEDLISNTPLKKLDFDIVHFESPDKRGIDVGMIYRKSRFKVLTARPIHVKMADNPKFTTRDILYVKGILLKDTVHIFYNHWPSRYGGMMNTVALRALAAHTLRHAVDSVMNADTLAKILMLGDFNDNPFDKSIQLLLHSGKIALEELKPQFNYGNTKGTIKHNTDWSVFDQVIVSPALFSTKGIHLKNHNMHVFDAGFLLINDEKNPGKKLNRTFVGFNYNGGYSDHLPVYVDVYKEQSH